jgi:hypothetical protein
MGIKRVLLIGFGAIIFFKISSCFLYKSPPLNLDRRSLLNNSFKTNGYYWSNLRDSNEGLKSIYFFYNNGVVLYGYSFNSNISLDSIDKIYRTNGYFNSARKTQTGWGVFHINDDRIKFETWGASNGPAIVVTRLGQILNHNSFIISNLYNGYTKKYYAKNDTFYFHAFSPKPDSTNAFIK